MTQPPPSPSPPATDGRAGLRPAAHLLAAVVLGQAIAAGGHGFSPAAVVGVGVAIAVVIAALFLPAAVPGGGAVRVVAAVGVGLNFARLPLLDLYLRLPAARPKVLPFVALGAVAAVLSVALVVRRPRRLLPACFPILLVTHGLMGCYYLSLSTEQRVDVYRVQQLGCAALLAGRDPYAITFPDPYGPNSPFYPPGVVVNGRVQCGFFYPPLSLLADLPAYVMAGDVRYAHLAACVLTAALLGYGLPRRGRAAATVLLFLTGTFQMVDAAWIDPFLALLLAVVVVASGRRWWRLAAVAVGLLLTAKQYGPFILPAVLLIVPRPWRVRGIARWAWPAAAAGAAVVLPFVVWGPGPFVRSLTVLNRGMLRTDSIGFLPLLATQMGWHPTLVVPALAAVPAAALVLARAPRTPAGFAAGAGLIWLCVFAFSTQAFGNYYYLVAAALCASAAAEA